MSDFYYEFLYAISPALQQLVTALVVAALTAATAWLKAKYDVERAKLSSDKQEALDYIAYNAVRAAEQLYVDNADKLKYAIDVTEKTLKSFGLYFDLDVIVSTVESQVFKLKQGA